MVPGSGNPRERLYCDEWIESQNTWMTNEETVAGKEGGSTSDVRRVGKRDGEVASTSNGNKGKGVGCVAHPLDLWNSEAKASDARRGSWISRPRLRFPTPTRSPRGTRSQWGTFFTPRLASRSLVTLFLWLTSCPSHSPLLKYPSPHHFGFFVLQYFYVKIFVVC